MVNSQVDFSRVDLAITMHYRDDLQDVQSLNIIEGESAA